MRFFNILICFCVSTVFADEQFSNKQYFIDSAQMLTECLYVIQKTGRFDVVEKQILSNANIGNIPPELKNIAKRIIETCQQGRIMLKAQGLIEKEYSEQTIAICLTRGTQLGGQIGTAIVTSGTAADPVGMIWTIYAGVLDFSKSTSQRNQKIDAVLQQLEYRIKSDMYDLRNAITENAHKYAIDAKNIISFTDLEEFEKILPAVSKNPNVINDFIQNLENHGL